MRACKWRLRNVLCVVLTYDCGHAGGDLGIRHDDDGFRRPVVFSKSKAIETLFKHSWNRSFIVPAAGMFLDVSMSDDQLKAVSWVKIGRVSRSRLVPTNGPLTQLTCVGPKAPLSEDEFRLCVSVGLHGMDGCNADPPHLSDICLLTSIVHSSFHRLF